MAKSKSVHLWMEPADYRRYEAIAKSRGVSVAELMRRTLEERFPKQKAGAAAAAQVINRMNLPLPEWDELRREIIGRRDDVVR